MNRLSPSPILVSIDSNEAARPRAKSIREAIEKDDHFYTPIGDKASLPSDLRFMSQASTLHVELKDFTGEGNSDYLSSILSGHLWEQCKKAASRTHRLDVDKMLKYHTIVDGFEANCLGVGIPVWRLKTDPYARMLLRVRKILQGGDISGFSPSPSEGERQAVGLSILAGHGVGPKMAHNILNRYNLCLMIRDGYCGDLEDCEGIGPKRAETIRKNIEVIE
jgi:hypothetical protein